MPKIRLFSAVFRKHFQGILKTRFMDRVNGFFFLLLREPENVYVSLLIRYKSADICSVLRFHPTVTVKQYHCSQQYKGRQILVSPHSDCPCANAQNSQRCKYSFQQKACCQKQRQKTHRRPEGIYPFQEFSRHTDPL